MAFHLNSFYNTEEWDEYRIPSFCEVICIEFYHCSSETYGEELWATLLFLPYWLTLTAYRNLFFSILPWNIIP